MISNGATNTNITHAFTQREKVSHPIFCFFVFPFLFFFGCFLFLFLFTACKCEGVNVKNVSDQSVIIKGKQRIKETVVINWKKKTQD